MWDLEAVLITAYCISWLEYLAVNYTIHLLEEEFSM
jgi:hypothetical protein